MGFHLSGKQGILRFRVSDTAGSENGRVGVLNNQRTALSTERAEIPKERGRPGTVYRPHENATQTSSLPRTPSRTAPTTPQETSERSAKERARTSEMGRSSGGKR